jgi:hypothetical protein
VEVKYSKHKIPTEDAKVLAFTVVKILNLSEKFPQVEWEVDEIKNIIINTRSHNTFDLVDKNNQEGRCARALLNKN